MIDSLPIKGKRIIPKDRFFTYLLIKYKGNTFISKRKGNDIWHSLYEFPLIESDKPLNINEYANIKEWKSIFGKVATTITYISPEVKHQLSHQTIFTTFVIVEIDRVSKKLKESFMMLPANEVDNYSVPRLIDSFLAAEPAANYFLNPPI
jgi:A/G-specific adenine glycosylase